MNYRQILESVSFTFDKMIDSLNTGKNFSLSRWGDGEWMAALGWSGKNTDKHIYYTDMGVRLKKILETGGKGELLALQSLATRDLAHVPEFDRLVKKNIWSANAEILARNHARDEEFFNAVGQREVIMVGNGYMRDVPFVVKEFVEIPLVNCWLEYNNILEEIEPEKDVVILYASSMMANVLINDLYSDLYTQIDVGSFLDPYVGRMTRRYHHKLKL